MQEYRFDESFKKPLPLANFTTQKSNPVITCERTLNQWELDSNKLKSFLDPNCIMQKIL